MKAEYYFEERFIKTNKEPNGYDLDKQRFDAYDMIDFAQQFAESYARIQIEKDRERVKDAVHESGLYHNHIGLNRIYNQTDITLD